MAKLKIGAAPAAFPLPVEIPTPHGPAEITLTVRHLLDTEWARIKDDNKNAIEAEVKALFGDGAKDVPHLALTELRIKHSTQALLKIASGWDLEEPFNAEQIAKMCDLYHGAAEAIFEAFHKTREANRAKN